ncbi:DUF4190 domain-containing protein [Cohnella silvisoli]|uniref:DUF4190 domain-containing protein n=1 Tax=Cohnella silvisoli TaxID=2873699 RepID=A0ABV1KS84_9BACL|nr:DUF4190 domain-containing protein [Cohnella silvisoli]MCD9022559.1 DUF4190 domain-containing protein [Cohnella silvisoli]
MDPYNNDPKSHHFSPVPQQYVPPKTNGKSIAAMVLGILAIVVPYLGFIIGIIAIIFASISLKEIRNNQEQGRGMAIAGLVCGIVGTAIYALILIFFVFAFAAFQGSSVNF